MKIFKRSMWFLLLIVSFLVFSGIGTAHAGPVIKFGENSWLLINYEMQLYLQSRDTGSGASGDSTTNDIYFRRNRLSFIGQVTDTYGFVFAVQHQGENRIMGIAETDTAFHNFDVLDAFLRADWTDAFRLRVGLTKDPLIREQNEGCFFPLSIDRSLFDYTDLPRANRDYGVVLWGNLLDAKVQYRLAAMKGNDSGDDPETNFRYTGRVHVSLLDPETSLVYRGTYLGTKKVLTFGAGYQFEPNAVYANLSAKTLPKDYSAWTFDGFFEYPTPSGTFTLSGAYLKTDFDEAYKGADPDTRSIGLNGEKKGWYAKAGYMLPMKVGPGNVQVYGRYEEWKFAELSGVFDQKIKWTGVGLNYLLKGQDLRISVEYSNNDFNKETTDTKDFSTWTAMLQFLF